MRLKCNHYTSPLLFGGRYRYRTCAAMLCAGYCLANRRITTLPTFRVWRKITESNSRPSYVPTQFSRLIRHLDAIFLIGVTARTCTSCLNTTPSFLRRLIYSQLTGNVHTGVPYWIRTNNSQGLNLMPLPIGLIAHIVLVRGEGIEPSLRPSKGHRLPLSYPLLWCP